MMATPFGLDEYQRRVPLSTGVAGDSPPLDEAHDWGEGEM